MLFLDANQIYFNKTTIYFHNGGKFDLHQLIRDCLFEYWGFKILTDRCIMSNGRWINFGIEGEDNECVMTFKDSCDRWLRRLLHAPADGTSSPRARAARLT